MSDDEAFIRAILAAPEDQAPRLIYADWLDERDDVRGEYLRLTIRLSETPIEDKAYQPLWVRKLEMRPQLPPSWLSLIADFRCLSHDASLSKREQAVELLGSRAEYVDEKGYNVEIVAADVNGLTGALAYVESRSRQVRPDYLDIKFHLHVEDSKNQKASWEVKTYNPYFGCEVGFLEWFGDFALVIYREKHNTYVCRFGIGCDAQFREIEDYWVLDGSRLGYWGYQEKLVRQIAIPNLNELKPLSVGLAERCGLLPRKTW